jgi:hypothetical protein
MTSCWLEGVLAGEFEPTLFGATAFCAISWTGCGGDEEETTVKSPTIRLHMNRRICRQVLECGDGVGEVTALALTTLFEWVGW